MYYVVMKKVKSIKYTLGGKEVNYSFFTDYDSCLVFKNSVIYSYFYYRMLIYKIKVMAMILFKSFQFFKAISYEQYIGYFIYSFL